MKSKPVTYGRAAQVVRVVSQMLTRLGIDQDITYWFWKIMVFPGSPFSPADGVLVESRDALPGPGGKTASYRF